MPTPDQDDNEEEHHGSDHDNDDSHGYSGSDSDENLANHRYPHDNRIPGIMRVGGGLQANVALPQPVTDSDTDYDEAPIDEEYSGTGKFYENILKATQTEIRCG